jgi:hypothetical protein
LQDLRSASEIISAQFERFDGTGFPDRLSEDTIPIGTRILTLASDYDNMQIGTLTPSRLNPEEAKIIIIHGSGKRYDPKVVAAFLDVLGGVPREEAERERAREIAVVSGDMQVGMVLSRDLITPSGLLMLSADHILDNRLISKIRSFERSGGLQLTAYIRADRTT